MNNIIIGIVSREGIVDNNKEELISKNIINSISDKASILGIINSDKNYADTEILNKCDGIIIPGGTDIYPYHFQIVKYAINNNIPLLGICLGNQILGLYSNKNKRQDLKEIKNHYNENHDINIIKDTKLYKLFGNKIRVNSRHKYALKEVVAPFKVSAISDDNVIEAIEYITDDVYLIGIQWHPEDIKNMNNLFNDFIKQVLINKIKKNNI